MSKPLPPTFFGTDRRFFVLSITLSLWLISFGFMFVDYWSYVPIVAIAIGVIFFVASMLVGRKMYRIDPRFMRPRCKN